MEIKISKCAKQCSACAQDFVHEQKVHSVARINDGSLERDDYCATCVPEESDEHLFCSWSTQYSDPKILESEHQETLSPLRRLFYDLAGSTERPDLAQAFLAAQLLKRQKAFKQIRESEEGDGATRVTLFLDRSGSRLIETRDLQFTYAELDTARAQLLESLRALETPESEQEPEQGDAQSDASEQHQTNVTPEEPDTQNGDDDT